MKYIERSLEEKIQKYIKKREIIAIVGARQCGKTTLMNHLFNKIKKKSKKFITFEDREVLELFVKDIKGFVDIYIKNLDFLFIDEFQYAKQGGKNLKFIYDTCKTKIMISGSSATDLSIQSIKYLVGRILVFQLNPLSFEEYLNYVDQSLYKIYKKEGFSEPIMERINRYYHKFVIYGGYPRVVLSQDDEEKKEVLKNIYNTYFLKEIKEILQISEDFKLSKLIKILSLQLGGLVNYNELSSATGFDYPELLKHLNILKKTFICLESRPFFTNKKKELVKTPKIYFLDNGFRNLIANNFQKIDDRTDFGDLNENFIASEILKSDIELKYWRTKIGAEVDFIIEREGKLIPIEVKTLLKSSKITRSFRNFLEYYKLKTGFILSKEYCGKKEFNKTKIFFFPLFNIRNILEKIVKERS